MENPKKSPLVGAKFIGFILALMAASAIEILSPNGLNEWASITIMGVYGAFCGSNAMISRGYAKASALLGKGTQK